MGWSRQLRGLTKMVTKHARRWCQEVEAQRAQHPEPRLWSGCHKQWHVRHLLRGHRTETARGVRVQCRKLTSVDIYSGLNFTVSSHIRCMYISTAMSRSNPNSNRWQHTINLYAGDHLRTQLAWVTTQTNEKRQIRCIHKNTIRPQTNVHSIPGCAYTCMN